MRHRAQPQKEQPETLRTKEFAGCGCESKDQIGQGRNMRLSTCGRNPERPSEETPIAGANNLIRRNRMRSLQQMRNQSSDNARRSRKLREPLTLETTQDRYRGLTTRLRNRTLRQPNRRTRILRTTKDNDATKDKDMERHKCLRDCDSKTLNHRISNKKLTTRPLRTDMPAALECEINEFRGGI